MTSVTEGRSRGYAQVLDFVEPPRPPSPAVLCIRTARVCAVCCHVWKENVPGFLQSTEPHLLLSAPVFVPLVRVSHNHTQASWLSLTPTLCGLSVFLMCWFGKLPPPPTRTFLSHKVSQLWPFGRFESDDSLLSDSSAYTFSGIPDLYSLDVRSTLPNFDTQKCLWILPGDPRRTKWPVAENLDSKRCVIAGHLGSLCRLCDFSGPQFSLL